MTGLSRIPFCIALFALAAPAGAEEVAPAMCQLDTLGSATVARVRDGRNLLLTDGREVRLAGIEVSPADASAKAAIERMTIGRDVALKRSGAAEDRYGRVVAYVSVTEDGGERLLQHALLAGGHARVSARSGSRTCATEMLAQERVARDGKLGLWADARFTPRQSADPASVSAERGRFTVIEGKVLSVRESGGMIYVNFGRRWTRDFTVTILKRNERTFTAAGIEPKKLEGRRVRVRGTVEQRSGPVVEATRPEQIEIAELI